MEMKKAGKVSNGQGFCCPHCADTKFPCVKMENSMSTQKAKEPEPEKTRES